MIKKPLSPSRQPSEIVLDYLEWGYLSRGAKDSRIPTIEQISTHLSVSASTVRNVIRKLIAEGRLEAVQGRGTFVRQGGAKHDAPLVLGSNMLSFSTAHAFSWSETIYFGAMRAAASMSRGVSMMPIAPPKEEDQGAMFDDLAKRMDHIDLLMLFPTRRPSVMRGLEVAEAYEKAGKPVIWVNPPTHTALENFVSADFFGATRRLGAGWLQTGRRKVLFIASGSFRYSVSDYLFLQGLAVGAERDEAGGAEFRVEAAGDITEESGVEVMSRLLAEGYRPNAIFCSSDHVALGVLSVMRKKGFVLHEDVSIACGTGLYKTLTACPEIIAIKQPMEQLGVKAVHLLCQRFENNNEATTGLFLPTSIHLGASKWPKECEPLLNP